MGRMNLKLDTEYFIENRRKFLESIEDNTLAVLFAGLPQRKSADQNHSFMANRNFYYITGIEQEGSALIIRKEGGKILKLVLCISTYDSHNERWYGTRLSREEASAVSGIYDIAYTDEIKPMLKQILDTWEGSVSIDRDATSAQDLWFSETVADQYPTLEIKNLFPIFSNLRKIKSPYEIMLMKKAIEATKDGILRIFETARAGMAEYEIAAEFEYVLAKKGLGEPSFSSIVATGKNFNYLHYPQLNASIEKGDLVLLDLGAYYGGLSSDISRVFPIDGKFTEKQRIVYEIVRACQEKAFELIRPGMYLRDINQACKDVAGAKLIEAGVMNKMEESDRYYWHNVSHHLGLDVHDICGRDVVLEAGMVLTVEPGVYVPEWNTGLRIEDDVLVTSSGNEILSVDIPREVEEIEKLLAR